MTSLTLLYYGRAQYRSQATIEAFLLMLYCKSGHAPITTGMKEILDAIQKAVLEPVTTITFIFEKQGALHY